MKQEMSWMGIWILVSFVMASLSLTYFYLSHELEQYGVSVVGLSLLSIILPYILWKYNQMKFVEKQEIIIQILND